MNLYLSSAKVSKAVPTAVVTAPVSTTTPLPDLSMRLAYFVASGPESPLIAALTAVVSPSNLITQLSARIILTGMVPMTKSSSLRVFITRSAISFILASRVLE